MARRKGRIALAFAAVVVGVAVVSILFSVSTDVGRKMNKELRTYGANMVLTPKSEMAAVETDRDALEAKFIREQDLARIQHLLQPEQVMGYSPYLYQVVDVGTKKAVLVGVWFDQMTKVNPYWRVEGKRVESRNDSTSALVGTELAEKLSLQLGGTFAVRFETARSQRMKNLRMAGVVRTGGSEDYQIFVSLPVAQTLTGQEGRFNLVALSVLGGLSFIQRLNAEIQEVVPNIRGEPILKIAKSEGQILNKIKVMMYVVTVIILIIASLAVMTTMNSLLVERREEIGLLKALGAEDRKVTALFLSESALIGLVGGLIGYLLGFALAQIIGRSVFATAITPRFEVLLLVVGLAIFITTFAVLVSLKHVLEVEPAIILKGE